MAKQLERYAIEQLTRQTLQSRKTLTKWAEHLRVKAALVAAVSHRRPLFSITSAMGTSPLQQIYLSFHADCWRQAMPIWRGWEWNVCFHIENKGDSPFVWPAFGGLIGFEDSVKNPAVVFHNESATVQTLHLNTIGNSCSAPIHHEGSFSVFSVPSV
ncbi:MAG TPA: hypothetical protein VKW70_01455 [Terriglobia bacterium]|nr:hypothetical protein [Terriglobia bacterium]